MLYNSLVALALAGSALANPFEKRGTCGDACAAVVTGKTALADGALRASYCKSFLATTVTPAAITTTTTVYGAATASSKSAWKRDTVTYCPNQVPVYAVSACGKEETVGGAAFSSACSCFGFTKGEHTTTIAPTTTTKTVYAIPTAACSTGAVITKTETSTVTVGPTGGYKSTVTVTATNNVTVTAAAPVLPTDSTCLTDAKATSIITAFINFLEHTNLNGGFNVALANATLASNFTDQSDSINFMAGKPLGSLTFPSPAAFIGGQGNQPPIPSVTTLQLWHDCHTITWRWLAIVNPLQVPVQGINMMVINAAGQIETNYSEFDNGAWLFNYGNPQCPKTNCSATAAAKRSEEGSLLKAASLH